MAKRAKKPVEVKRTFTNTKVDKTLVFNDSFIYEVEIYKYIPRSMNLEDSKLVSSKSYSKETVEWFTKESIKFKKVVRLIAAPEKWLLENNYTENKES